MKNITPKDTRYVPFVQQKSCCVPTCLSMVMYRHGLPLISQEELGYYLGLTIAPEFKKLFWNVRSGKRPQAGYGTQIYKKEFSLNTAFRKLKIPLEMVYYPVSSFDSVKDLGVLLDQNVTTGGDMLVCFNHGILNKEDGIGGHVCVVDRVDVKKGIVRLVDPQINQPKWRVVKLSSLFKAMQVHADKNMGGVWQLINIKK